MFHVKHLDEPQTLALGFGALFDPGAPGLKDQVL
jgi:hypothetical protein